MNSYGVASFPDDPTPNGCLPGSGQSNTTKNARVFNPDYLSSCPYITSVGATMIPKGGSVTGAEVGAFVKFGSEDTYSGSGGFSNYFARPTWQADAVESWYQNTNGGGYKSYSINKDLSNIGQDGGLYNKLGRAFP